MAISRAGVTRSELDDAMQAVSDHVDEKFEEQRKGLEVHFGRIDGRFILANERLDTFEGRLDRIEESIHVIAMTLKSIDERFERMEKRMDEMDSRIDRIDGA